MKVVLYVYRDGISHFEEALKDYCQSLDIPMPLLSSLCRTERGKQYFPDPDAPCFSISHSRGLWLAVFAPTNIGLDAEVYRPRRYTDLAKRFFHPDECAYVKEHGRDGFYRVWCAKESRVKFTGRGIDGTFSAFSAVNDGVISGIDTATVITEVDLGENICCMITTEEPIDLEVKETVG